MLTKHASCTCIYSPSAGPIQRVLPRPTSTCPTQTTAYLGRRLLSSQSSSGPNSLHSHLHTYMHCSQNFRCGRIVDDERQSLASISALWGICDPHFYCACLYVYCCTVVSRHAISSPGKCIPNSILLRFAFFRTENVKVSNCAYLCTQDHAHTHLQQHTCNMSHLR